MLLKLLRTESYILPNIKPYTYFSQIYSHLMQSVDYSYWANYISEIHNNLGKKTDIALELAAGNCKLAENLKNQFSKIYLSDFSLEMLKISKSRYPLVCCDMLELPFKILFDFIFTTFDSINYLNTENGLLKFLNKIKINLSKDGLFLFDASLKKNSLKHLKKLNRKGSYKGLEYIQKSEFFENDSLHINTVKIKTKDGKIFTEVHKQKIYDFYYYFEALELTGFYVLECFDAFTFNEGKPDSKRVQFVVKRNR